MELRPDFQKVYDEAVEKYFITASFGVKDAVMFAIERCAALADRPRVQLTDDEIDELWNTNWNIKMVGRHEMSRIIIAAYDAKQKEPIEVPFDYEQWSKGGWQAYLGDDPQDAICTKYLHSYTMRKI